MCIIEKLQQRIIDILPQFISLNLPINLPIHSSRYEQAPNLIQQKINIPLYLIAPSGYAENSKLQAAYQFFKNFLLTQQINQHVYHIAFEVLDERFTEISTRRHQRFGGTITQRIDDFNFKNTPKYSIVMPVRGGYGLSEVLPYLDLNMINQQLRDRALFLLGYSDFSLFHLTHLTSLMNLPKSKHINQNTFNEFNLSVSSPSEYISTFAGPMFASDFYYQPQPSLYTILSLILAYFQYQISVHLNIQDHENNLYLKRYTKSYQQNLDDDGAYQNNLNCQPYDHFNNHFNANIKLDSIQGKLWGGNLSMICHALGTPILSPQIIQNQILFIEDIAEAPYSIDRMLYQLYYAGVLMQQKAVILGQFTAYKTTTYDNGFNLSTVLNKWSNYLNKAGVPLLTGLNFGHTYHKQTLSLGADYHIYMAD